MSSWSVVSSTVDPGSASSEAREPRITDREELILFNCLVLGEDGIVELSTNLREVFTVPGVPEEGLNLGHHVFDSV